MYGYLRGTARWLGSTTAVCRPGSVGRMRELAAQQGTGVAGYTCTSRNVRSSRRCLRKAHALQASSLSQYRHWGLVVVEQNLQRRHSSGGSLRRVVFGGASALPRRAFLAVAEGSAASPRGDPSVSASSGCSTAAGSFWGRCSLRLYFKPQALHSGRPSLHLRKSGVRFAPHCTHGPPVRCPALGGTAVDA